MRTLVAVLATRTFPYPLLVRTIERTWAARDVDGVEVLFYYGGHVLEERGDDLTLPVPDDFSHIGGKTRAAFAHVLENREFDVLFRANCSSYVDLSNLRSYVREHARRSRFYAGRVDERDGIRFASGAGYFLSRDLVERAVDRADAWDDDLLDDVALGQVLAQEGVEPEPAPRVDYRTAAEVRGVDVAQFHFRCKTSSRFRVEDVEIMLALDDAFARSRGLRGGTPPPWWPLVRGARAASRFVSAARR